LADGTECPVSEIEVMLAADPKHMTDGELEKCLAANIGPGGNDSLYWAAAKAQSDRLYLHLHGYQLDGNGRVLTVKKVVGGKDVDVPVPRHGSFLEEKELAKFFQSPSEWQVEEPKEIVKDLLIEDGVHVFAGLFESMKTMASYELAAAVIEGRPAFGFFPVFARYPVVHLCLDMSPKLQLKYLSYFGLHRNPEFKGLNPKADAVLPLDSDDMKRECAGKVLILDTMLDWFSIREAFQSQEWVENFARLRQLIKHGCKAVVLIAHPTKSGARNTTIDATEFLKDSVTFGGKLDVAFAFRRLEKTSKIFVERIKGRMWERPITFTLASHDENGDSFIERGQFPVVDRPGEAGTLAGQLDGKNDQGLREALEKGMSHRAIAKMFSMSQPTVTRRAKALGFSKKQQLDLIEGISKEGDF
jgi:hypothetical protein